MVVLAFIPRMRLFAPVLVAGIKVSFKKFLLYDTISLVLFTAVYISLGAIFNKSIGSLIGKTNSLQDVIFFGSLILIAGILILMIRKREEPENETPGEQAAEHLKI